MIVSRCFFRALREDVARLLTVAAGIWLCALAGCGDDGTVEPSQTQPLDPTEACNQVCAEWEAAGCPPSSGCVDGCVTQATKDGPCGGAYTALQQCSADEAMKTGACKALPMACSEKLLDYGQCKEPHKCIPTSSSSDLDSCMAHSICGDADVPHDVSCDSTQCTCAREGVTIGTCARNTEDSSACSAGEGCCAALFF
jgi:hypothetical protein